MLSSNAYKRGTAVKNDAIQKGSQQAQEIGTRLGPTREEKRGPIRQPTGAPLVYDRGHQSGPVTRVARRVFAGLCCGHHCILLHSFALK